MLVSKRIEFPGWNDSAHCMEDAVGRIWFIGKAGNEDEEDGDDVLGKLKGGDSGDEYEEECVAVVLALA